MCIGFMTFTVVPSKRIQSSNLDFTPVFCIILLLFSYSLICKKKYETQGIKLHKTNNHFKLK